MAILDLIKRKLEQAFQLHGMTVSLLEQGDVVRNALNEIISAFPSEVPQLVIPKRVLREIDNDLPGDLPDGTFEFVAKTDTLIKESKLIKFDRRIYHVESFVPYRAFGVILCFVGRAERADGNE